MPDDLQAFFVTIGDDAQGRVVLDLVRGVHERAVHFAGQGRLGQARADIGRNVHDADGMVELSLAAVRQGDHRHGTVRPFKFSWPQ